MSERTVIHRWQPTDEIGPYPCLDDGGAWWPGVQCFAVVGAAALSASVAAAAAMLGRGDELSPVAPRDEQSAHAAAWVKSDPVAIVWASGDDALPEQAAATIVDDGEGFAQPAPIARAVGALPWVDGDWAPPAAVEESFCQPLVVVQYTPPPRVFWADEEIATGFVPPGDDLPPAWLARPVPIPLAPPVDVEFVPASTLVDDDAWLPLTQPARAAAALPWADDDFVAPAAPTIVDEESWAAPALRLAAPVSPVSSAADEVVPALAAEDDQFAPSWVQPKPSAAIFDAQDERTAPAAPNEEFWPQFYSVPFTPDARVWSYQDERQAPTVPLQVVDDYWLTWPAVDMRASFGSLVRATLNVDEDASGLSASSGIFTANSRQRVGSASTAAASGRIGAENAGVASQRIGPSPT